MIGLIIRDVSIRFQSAPPRGRRLGIEDADYRAMLFQSAPPRGRRLPLRRPGPRLAVVSIRASAREATA